MANTGAGYGGAEEGFAAYGTDPLVSSGSGAARGVELFLRKKSSEIPSCGLLSISYSVTEFKALDGISRPGSFDQRWIINAGEPRNHSFDRGECRVMIRDLLSYDEQIDTSHKMKKPEPTRR